MERGSQAQGKHHTVRVSGRMGEGQCVVAPLYGLVRIAQQPQRQGHIGELSRPRVLSVKEGMGTMLLGIVEAYPVLELFAGRGELPQEEQAPTQRYMGFQEEPW